MACFISSSTPSFLAADIGTTGTPNMDSIPFTSIVPPFPVTSSIILSATTIGIFISRSCIVRYRLRSILVASTMFIIASGLSSSTKLRDTISSLLYGDIEYIPGRSVTSVFLYPFIGPSFLSTVTPGKLPTCWLEPVSWLKSVVLPQFWLPTRAYVRIWESGNGFSSALT